MILALEPLAFRKKGQVKTILMLIIGLMLAGCGSLNKEVRNSSTADLKLRRSQLMYRLSMNRVSWGNRPFESSAYDDVKHDLKEKEAIERELARRNVAF
jgi:hypothetical protein